MPDRMRSARTSWAYPLLAVAGLALLTGLNALLSEVFRRRRYGEVHGDDALLQSTSVPLLALGILETAVLLALFLLFQRRGLLRVPAVRIAGIVAIAVMMFGAFLQPSDGDAWAYVGYGIVPSVEAAYDTPREPFAGSFRRINDEWGTPMLPSIYGPVWNGYLQLLVHHVPTLESGVIVLKSAAVLWYLAFLALLAYLRVPQALTALVAVNPAIIEQFVTSVHNDLPGVVLALLALAALQRGRWAPAIVLLAAAALIKITFLAVALSVLAGWGTLPRRVAAFAAVAALTAGGIAIVGAPFLQAMAKVGGDWMQGSRVLLAVHGAVAAVAAATLIAAFVWNQWFPGAVWSLSAMNAMFYSWYQAWGIPYAVRTARSWAAAGLFIAWPVVVEMIHAPVWKLNGTVVLMLMFGAAGFSLVRTHGAHVR
jgi:hypothetical protein